MDPPSLLLCLLFLSAVLSCDGKALNEVERVEEYHRRKYSWPPQLVPETEGWKKFMDRRFAQVQRLPQKDAGRYEGWMNTVGPAYVSPNFTETGWGLTRAPDELVETLRKAIRDGLGSAREERELNAIEGQRPLLIRREDLTKRVLSELQPMHEAWSGMKLLPSMAYGFRLYRNQSNLLMHVDRAKSHVISCILHIDSSDDADPWPIFIEDFQGNTNEVVLKPGDMLFYESAKCFHGRPMNFTGSWYSSVFVHYRPAVGWDDIDRDLERHYGIPPHWGDPVPEPNDDDPERLVMRGTTFKEPDCEHDWCALVDTVKWSGPAEMDYVITTGKKYPLWGQEEDEL